MEGTTLFVFCNLQMTLGDKSVISENVSLEWFYSTYLNKLKKNTSYLGFSVIYNNKSIHKVSNTLSPNNIWLIVP